MPFSLVSCDISQMAADCIVVAADTDLRITGGVGLAVAERAGFQKLQAACLEAAPVARGSCALTPAFGLDARHIAHVVGPVWHNGSHGEDILLARAYACTMQTAWEAGDRSIAMPLVSTGAFGFPVRWAFDIAVREIGHFLANHDEMDVRLVLWGEDARATGRERFPELGSYIEGTLENSSDVPAGSAPEYGEEIAFAASAFPFESGFDAEEAGPSSPAATPREQARHPTETGRANRRGRPKPARAQKIPGPRGQHAPEPGRMFGAGQTLEAMLRQRDRSFSEELVWLIDERGLKDPQVYRAANITRQLFSKIRSKSAYRPTKKIALALAVALRLSLEQTDDLLARAGLALSHASVFDIIVEYHIVNEIYDVAAINEALYAYDQELLGSNVE